MSGNVEEVYNESIWTYYSELATNSVGSNIARYGPASLCPLNGDYELTEKLLDEITRGKLGKKFLSVWSAGNERGYGLCGVTYNTIGIPAGAKNIITIGATNSDDNSMTDFSSWGPVDDGRLKPELVGPGCQVGLDEGINSTYPDTAYPYTDYAIMCGTSMATPAVSGTIALMLQQMKQFRGSSYMPWPSTVKAILIQTAIDLNNTGPDYTTGFGHVDAKDAIDLIIADNPNRDMIIEDSVSQNTYDYHYFTVPAGAGKLRVTLAWDDYAGTPFAAKELVNNLNLRLRAPDGTYHNPWRLDPDNPANPATKIYGDPVNNVEQVEVNNPIAGRWRARVWGSIVPHGPQDYSLVLPYEEIECGEYLDRDIVLTHNLTCTGDGLNLNKDGITLDCNGHTITGDRGYGDYGIEAHGNDAGGFFQNSAGSSQVKVGAPGLGVEATGN